MQTSSLIILIFGLSALSYLTGRKRAERSRSDGRLLALPAHYGYMTALWSALPALVLLLAWLILEPGYLHERTVASLPETITVQSRESVELYVNNVLLAVQSGDSGADPVIQTAAKAYTQAAERSRLILSAIIFVLCLSGIAFALSRHLTRIHARRSVESMIRLLLMACSGVAN